jgi:hypothetical protein
VIELIGGQRFSHHGRRNRETGPDSRRTLF